MKAEQLRKSILQMAIQGKLVPQNPNDEPASVLLERIRAEKQRLIKEGKIKKDKGDSIIFKGEDNCYYEKVGNFEPALLEDLPYEIPDSWYWVRHNDIIEIFGGSQPPKSKFIANERDGYIRLYQIRDYGPNPSPVYIPINTAHKITKKGDILLARYGASVGKVFWAEYGAYNVAMAKVEKLYIGEHILDKYLYLFYKAPLYQTLVLNNSRSAQAGFNKEDLDSLFIPLPPLAEQARIVEEIEKYEPLIAEYDKLEQQATKLDGEIYGKLKKSILQYAIQSKLVEQDENDEPASVLLERIRAEKKAKLGKKYVESYIYKGDDNCYYEHIGGKDVNITKEIPFDLPKNWCWTRLGNAFQLINGDRGKNYPSKDKLKDKGDYPFISAINMYAHTVKTEGLLFLSKLQYDLLGSGKLKKDDFVFCLRGSLGKFCKYPYENGAIASSLVILRKEIPLLNDYIETYLSSFLIDEQIHNSDNGTAQPNLGARDIAKYLIPIPPLTEQERIVSKINEIFTKL